MRFYVLVALMLSLLLPLPAESATFSPLSIGVRLETGAARGGYFTDLYSGLESVNGFALLLDWNINRRIALELAPGFQYAARGISSTSFRHRYAVRRFRADFSMKWYFRPLSWNIASYLSLGGSMIMDSVDVATSSVLPDDRAVSDGPGWRAVGGGGISFHFSCINANFQLELLLEAGSGGDIAARLSFGLIFHLD